MKIAPELLPKVIFLLRIKDKLLKRIKQRPQLSLALLLSALLHLLLFAAVTVVVEPTLKLTLYPKVAFLGSILNRDTDSRVALPNKLKVAPENIPYSFRRKPVRIVKRVGFLKFRRKSPMDGSPKTSTLSSVNSFKKINAQTILNKFGEQPEYSEKNSAQISLDYFQRSLTKLENILARDDNPPKLSAQANAIYFPKRLKEITFVRIRAKSNASPKISTSGKQNTNERYLYRKLQPSVIAYRSKAIYLPKRSGKEPKAIANIFWNSSYRRSVLYKPRLPDDHFRGDGVGGDFNLEFDFLVSPQGRIIAVKKLTSSGFAKVDARAMRYLKKWQFTPSPREQWGRIRLNFKLR